MLPVNDDMDELFRKAADDYPLRTDSADWEKVRRQLEAATVPKEERKDRRYLLFLLLLLIPFSWLGYNLFNSHAASSAKTTTSSPTQTAQQNLNKSFDQQNKN